MNAYGRPPTGRYPLLRLFSYSSYSSVEVRYCRSGPGSGGLGPRAAAAAAAFISFGVEIGDQHPVRARVARTDSGG